MKEKIAINSIFFLSLKFDIFKNQIRRHMFLLILHRKILKMIIKKQFFLVAKQKSQIRRQRIKRLS